MSAELLAFAAGIVVTLVLLRFAFSSPCSCCGRYGYCECPEEP